MNVKLWFILLALISGYLCHASPCLTWELHQKELKLVFKTNDFATSVSFYDKYGTERGFCDFNTSCHDILYEKEKRQVVLKLGRYSEINGKWSCRQGFDNFSTHVTSTGDISKSTHLKMKGSILHRQNKTLVQVECASCREPYRNQVHYLLNKRFGDIVSYRFNSNICTNNNGECRGSICSCSPFGNMFTRAFERDGYNTMTFSCAMKFSTALQDFVKVSHLLYDGKDGFTFTEIQDTSPTKDAPPIIPTVASTTEGMDIWVPLVIVLVVFVFLVIILFYCYLRMRRRKCNGLKNKSETLQLLPIRSPRITDSTDANNDGLKRWIILKCCLQSVASVRLREYVKSFVEILFKLWEDKCHIKSQSFRCHVVDYQHKIKLNYTAINCNEMRLDRNMDYKVGNYIDFSKLFLPTSLTGYSDFNSECNIESLLELVIKISEFPTKLRELAEELIHNVLKPCKEKNDIDNHEYEAAINTLKRFIKSLDCDWCTDLDIYDKYGMSAIDQQFLDEINFPFCTEHSFEEATLNLKKKCQSVQERTDGHSSQLGENLAGKKETIELNKMKQIDTTAISSDDHICKDAELFKDNEEEKGGKIHPPKTFPDFYPEASTTHSLSSSVGSLYSEDSGFKSLSSSDSDTSVYRLKTELLVNRHHTDHDQRLLEEDDKMKKETEYDIAKLLGRGNRDLDRNSKAWLVIGIGLHSVLLPVLRTHISDYITKMYNSLKVSNKLDRQQYPDILAVFEKHELDYGSINDNRKKYGKYKIGHYDYKVSNPVDFSKLFVQPVMADYSDFDDSLSLMCALQILLCKDVLHETLSEVMRMRQLWTLAEFSKWDDQMYLSSFKSMERLIEGLHLERITEQSALAKLNNWKTNGHLFKSSALDLELINEVREQAHVLTNQTSISAGCTTDQMDKLFRQFSHLDEETELMIRNLLSELTNIFLRQTTAMNVSTSTVINNLQERIRCLQEKIENRDADKWTLV